MSMTKERVLAKMKDKNVTVLNVLPGVEFEVRHITGSKNIPFGSRVDEFAHAVEKRFGKDRLLITHCADGSCMAGPAAAMALQKRGFKADDYPGGTREWSEAGYPTEGTGVKPKAPVAAVLAAAHAARL
jgi:rhodanese-related sulfurtransferase